MPNQALVSDVRRLRPIACRWLSLVATIHLTRVARQSYRSRDVNSKQQRT
jgi:hypothetical protein